MITEGKDDGQNGAGGEPALEQRDDEALWLLLGRAGKSGKSVKVSPYFSRRVLREVAALEDARKANVSGPLGWLANAWRSVSSAPRASLRFAGAFAVAALLVATGAGFGRSLWHGGVAQVAVGVPVTAVPVANAVVADVPGVAGLADGPVVARAPQSSSDPVPDTDPSADLPPESGVAELASNAAQDAVSAQDVEVIADLDSLVAREENRLWTEDSARF